MSLALTCTSCARKLRLNERLAGKRIKCPTCQTILLVPQPTPVGADGVLDAPAPGRSRESDSAIALDALPPIAELGDVAYGSGELWRMKTVEGDYYGPVSRQELDNWFHDGRIDGQCQLMRVGTNQWQNAALVYPFLASLTSSALLPTPQHSGVHSAAPPAERVDGFSAERIGESLNERNGERHNGHHANGDRDRPDALRDSAVESSGSGSSAGEKSGQVAVRARQRVKALVAAERQSESRAGSTARSGDTSGIDPPAAVGEGTKLSDRSRLVAGLLALFLGTLGMHRIYLGYVTVGLIQLATLGGFGIWAVVDAIRIFVGKVPDAQGRKLRP